MTVQFVQAKKTTLAVGISSTETGAIVLKKFVDVYGNALAMSDFGTIGYITIDPGGDNEEIISYTGFTVNSDGSVTLDTGITRGLAAKAPYGAGGTASQHAAGVSVVVSNNPQLYASLVSLTGDQTVAGRKTFSTSPTVPDPTLNTDAANKEYADGIATAGAPNANTTTKGIVQIATQAQQDAGTAVGSTGASIVPTPALIRSKQTSDYVASDTGSANVYAIAPAPVFIAYAAGQRYIFKAATANTGASTLNVNALGIKTIKKNATLDLVQGDIVVGQIIECMYDGVNMQMLTPAALSVTPTGTVMPFAGNAAPTGFLVCDGSAVSRTTYAGLFAIISPAQVFTVTIATPGVISATAHGLQIGDKIRLTTTGALPTGLVAATDYFVISAGFGANAFQVSASRGGSAVNTSGSQSGVHTMRFSNYGVGDGSTTFNVPNFKGKTLYGQDTGDTNFDNLNAPTVYPGEKTHQLVIAEMPSHNHVGAYGQGFSVGSALIQGNQSSSSATQNVPSQGGDGAHNNMPPYAVTMYIIKI